LVEQQNGTIGTAAATAAAVAAVGQDNRDSKQLLTKALPIFLH